MDKSSRISSRPLSSPPYLQSREKASRFAILGMLALGRTKSGYDIKKAIAGSTSNFWSESYSNIYPGLRRLLAEGSVREESDPTPAGKRRKQLYSITAKGEQAFTEWLRQPVAPYREDNELLLKLFFGSMMSRQDACALVSDHREYHHKLLKKFEAIETDISAGRNTRTQKTYTLATLEYGKAISRALIEWSDATIQSLQTPGRR